MPRVQTKNQNGVTSLCRVINQVYKDYCLPGCLLLCVRQWDCNTETLYCISDIIMSVVHLALCEHSIALTISPVCLPPPPHRAPHHPHRGHLQVHLTLQLIKTSPDWPLGPLGGGGHYLFEGRYPKQDYRPPVLCYHSPLSLSLLVHSPLFLRYQGQSIVITVGNAVYSQQA